MFSWSINERFNVLGVKNLDIMHQSIQIKIVWFWAIMKK
jgi:hypothetical protein